MNFFPTTDLKLHVHALSEKDPNGMPFPHETAKVEDGFHLLDGFTVSYSLSRTDIPLERGYAGPKQGWDGGLMNNVLLPFHPGKSDGGTNREQDQTSSRPRRKGSYLLNDRRRRHRISERIVALQQLVPNSKGGGPTSAMDEITSYILHLQLQLENLSGSTLGAKPVRGNNPLFFPQRIGLGNYTHVHGHTMNTAHGSIREVMGNLMEERPLLARKLLESKGLLLVPTTLANELGSIGISSSSSSSVL